jgi:hypothetical protein
MSFWSSDEARTVSRLPPGSRTIVALGAALYPAFKAALIAPVEAMRHA